MAVSTFRDTTQGDSQFQLNIAPFPANTFEVVSFQGREEMSKPFTFDLLVLAGPDVEAQETLLGQPAELVIQVPDRASRLVRGIIASVEPEVPAAVQGRHAHRLQLVPRLWLLRHRVASRIFQDKTVPEIVTAVLAEAKITATLKLSRAYRRRAYCVQYQESDLAFVRRLLAEEGIFYFFEHPTKADDHVETLVLGDSPEAYPAIAEGGRGLDLTGEFVLGKMGQAPAPRLRVRERGGMTPTEDDVLHFSLRRSIRPGAVLLHDYDFRRPLLDLKAEEGTDTALRVYNHRGEYDEAEADAAGARAQLEQHRRAAVRGEGKTICRRLLPGHRFRLAAETDPRLSGEYVVTRIDHEGHAPAFATSGGDSYTARFECVPASVAFRPKRPRHVLRQVLESAVVVGPQNEEIHVDTHGRIKVQFHWDLDGKRNEHSSCWIRVIQTWAGTSWGLQFIPRVGMEVMVTFLGGDQDCPVIIGCAYNATHPPPFMLPHDKTKSGIRTQSTPRSDGFNQLSFEDAAGQEQIFVHAQRDLDEVVERNRTMEVHGHLQQSVAVGRNEQVGRDYALTVLGNHGVEVGGEARFAVHQNRSTSVDGDDLATIRGNASITVALNHSLAVEGDQSVVVGNGVSPAQSDTYVYGSASIGTSDRLVLRAERGLLLECGSSAIEVTPDGISLRARAIDVKAAESATISGKGPSLSLDSGVELVAKAVRFYSEGASIELTKDASIKGDRVLLNCDAGKPIGDAKEGRRETQPFSCKLSDWYLKPYANKKYHLMVEGLKFEGTTDADGIVRQSIPKGARQVVIKLWIDEYPTGRQRMYTLSMAETPPADTPQGAQARLRHLGYYSDEPTDEMTAEAKNALAAFQKDHAESHQLSPTGELDAATIAALQAVYGS